MARPYYHQFAWAYDFLQTENVPARVDFIQHVLAHNGMATEASVLDAGCGTGRYAAELSKRSFRVCGVDGSADLIAVARGRESDAEFMLADLLEVAFQRTFDCVLCRGVLNDFVEDGGRRAIFRQFSAWLRPAGILLFDVRDWDKTVARYRHGAVHRKTVDLPDGVLQFESQTELDHESRRMLIHERFVFDGVITENEFVMRPWTEEQIAECLKANGLEIAHTGESYGDGQQGWSDRLVITARKAC